MVKGVQEEVQRWAAKRRAALAQEDGSPEVAVGDSLDVYGNRKEPTPHPLSL